MAYLVVPIKSSMVIGLMLEVREEIGEVVWVLFRVLKTLCKVYAIQLL